MPVPPDVHHPSAQAWTSHQPPIPKAPNARAPLLPPSVGGATLPMGSGATRGWGTPRTTKPTPNLGDLILLLPLVLPIKET